jgi:SAM-dependent methyltransferase
MDLAAEFGRIDIYLFDQLLRGRIARRCAVLDAGCGDGRNLVYLLRNGYQVYATDVSRASISTLRTLAARLAPHLPADNFRVEPVEAMSFPDGFADVVLSSAVLHFARDDDHFAAMVSGTWRAIKPGGMLCCRLASTSGMEGIGARMQPLGGRRFVLPDGTERYLVDERMLLDTTRDLGGELLDPLKTTVVQDQRCMTTWVVRKRA